MKDNSGFWLIVIFLVGILCFSLFAMFVEVLKHFFIAWVTLLLGYFVYLVYRKPKGGNNEEE